MSHKVINRDGYAECYACGTTVEFTPDGDTGRGFELIRCKPGGWDHPPYVYPPTLLDRGFTAADEDAVTFETCAAHPYENCAEEARKVIETLTPPPPWAGETVPADPPPWWRA